MRIDRNKLNLAMFSQDLQLNALSKRTGIDNDRLAKIKEHGYCDLDEAYEIARAIGEDPKKFIEE